MPVVLLQRFKVTSILTASLIRTINMREMSGNQNKEFLDM